VNVKDKNVKEQLLCSINVEKSSFLAN